MKFFKLLFKIYNYLLGRHSQSLADKILRGIVVSYTIISAIILMVAIAASVFLVNKSEQYTCNYLSVTSDLLSYQVGREIALKNYTVANELIAKYSNNIKDVIPGSLTNFAFTNVDNETKQSKQWDCELHYNILSFKKAVTFGQMKLGSIKGQIRFFNGWIFLLLFVFVIGTASYIIYSLGNHIYLLFDSHVFSPLKSIASNNFDSIGENLTKEMNELINKIIESHNKHIDAEKTLANFQSQVELSNLAAQVSHDIRSPVSALNMALGHLETLPEPYRIMIRSSVNRINDIANSLLNHSKRTTIDNFTESHSLENTLLASLIESVVSEKRISFWDKKDIQIEARLENSYGLFSKINPAEMKRLLSNTINNSIEAFEHNDGLVEIFLYADNFGNAIIEIKDNGKGMPLNVLEKLGQKGISHGKNNTASGTGLGVYHAKKTIESFGGQFRIESTEYLGTSVIISLKAEQPPEWFVRSLVFQRGETVVAIDDDNSILSIWQQKFDSLIKSSAITLITCNSGKCLEDWIANNPTRAKNTIYLTDYELLGQSKTGLDLIDELGIGKQSILVSSRYEETAIKVRCHKLGVRIIPKGMAPLIHVELKKTNTFTDTILTDDYQINSSNINYTTTDNLLNGKFKYDLCLIDDDVQLIHTVWASVAADKGMNIKMFSNPEAFLEVANSIDRLTPIYIDVSLQNGVKGTDVAQLIHQLGFVEINLATGYDLNSIQAPPFICRVVGKDFPY
ncbi:MAG: sensor histidine kinase [Bdellovibrio sp.]